MRLRQNKTKLKVIFWMFAQTLREIYTFILLLVINRYRSSRTLI